MPALSTRYSTLPAFSSCTALPTSKVTVPSFGLGIRPRGPSTLPRRPTTPIMSGVAIALSNSSQPSSWIFLTRSSAPTTSAPASCASLSLSPLAKTATRTDLAGAVRQHDRAAHVLIGVARIDAETDGELDASRRTSPSASSAREADRLVERVALARGRPSPARAFIAFHACHVLSLSPRRRCPSLRAVPSMVRIAASSDSADEIRQLQLGDLPHLRARHLADLVLFGSPEPFSTPAAFFSSTAAGGVLGMKVKERSA